MRKNIKKLRKKIENKNLTVILIFVIITVLLSTVISIASDSEVDQSSNIIERQLGSSGEFDEEDNNPSLGLSLDIIEIHAPDRKIALGISNFDLKTGMKATNEHGENALPDVEVTYDNDFNAFITDDYLIEYRAGKQKSVSRTITVTDYIIQIEHLLLNQEEKYEGKDEDETEESEFVQNVLLQDITVHNKDGKDVTEFLQVVDDDGFSIYNEGNYEIEYALIQDGEVKVQTNRMVSMSPGVGTRAATVVWINQAFTDGHISLGYARNGSWYVGYDVYNPSYQFYGGWSSGTGFYVNGDFHHTYYWTSANANNGNDDSRVGTLGLGNLTLLDNGRTIRAEWHKDGMNYSNTMTLRSRAQNIEMAWNVTNNTGSQKSDVRIYAGGDPYYGGTDLGYAYYSRLLNMIYVRRDAGSGIMAFQFDESTPIAHYDFRKYHNAIISYLAGQHLRDSGNGSNDPGLYFEWDFDLADGESGEARGGMSWSSSGTFQLIEPTTKRVPADVEVSYNFNVINFGAAKNLTLSAVSSNGWPVSIYGGNTFHLPANSDTSSITVTLTVPANAVNGMVDTLTLSAVSGGETQIAKAITVVDEDLPAITNIELVAQSNTHLTVAVYYKNHPNPPHSTEVKIIDAVTGNDTNLIQTKPINSGDEYTFDISDLTMNQDYIVRAKVEGIDYPAQRRVTISTQAESIVLDKIGPITLRGGAFSEHESITATILPSTVTNKNIEWDANPGNLISFSKFITLSGEPLTIGAVNDGITTLQARAVASTHPTATIKVQVDGTYPDIDTIELNGISAPQNIITNSAVMLNLKASDPQMGPVGATYASGMKNIYYRTVTAGSPAPNFDDPPTGWTVYQSGATIPPPVNGVSELDIYMVAVDNVGNETYRKGGPKIIFDTIPPVITAPDVHILEGESFDPKSGVTIVDNGSVNIPVLDENISGTVNTNVVGRHALTYTVKDAAGNTTTHLRHVYVHGKVVVEATDRVYIHQLDSSMNTTLLNDPRIALKATTKVVAIDGNITEINIPVSSITYTGSVTYHTIGQYPISYTATHNNQILGRTITGKKDVIVEIVKEIPSGPRIALVGTSPKSFYQDNGYTITQEEINNYVVVSGPNNAKLDSVIIRNSTGSQRSLAQALATIDEYTISYKAQDTLGNTAYLNILLQVNGGLVFDTVSSIHVVEKPNGILADEDYKGIHLPTAHYLSYEKVGTEHKKIPAVISQPENISISTYGKGSFTVRAVYPPSTGVNYFKTTPRELFVYGVPKITVSPVTISVFDTASDLIYQTNHQTKPVDSRFELKATVKTFNPNGDAITEIITSETTTKSRLFTVSGTVHFGTIGVNSLTYSLNYTHIPNKLWVSGSEMSYVTITTTNPEGPVITVSGDDPLQFFQSYTTVFTRQEIIDNISSVAQDTATIVSTEFVVKNSAGVQRANSESANFPAEMASLLGTIGRYTITYKVTDSNNRTNYLDIDLHVFGKIVFDAPKPIDIMTSTDFVPEDFYTGSNQTTVSYLDYNNVRQSARLIDYTKNINRSTVKQEDITYTAGYPTNLNAPGTARETEKRLVRVHGRPVFTSSDTQINRVGEPISLLTNGVTATVEFAGKERGDPNLTYTQSTGITISLVSSHNLDEVSSFSPTLKASYSLPSDYNPTITNPIEVEGSPRKITLHGYPVITGDAIVLSTGFLASDFDTMGLSKMNARAQVTYFDENTNGPKAHVIPSGDIDFSHQIQFGTAGTYPVTFAVNDDSVVSQAPGLSGLTEKIKTDINVTLIDDIVGNAPVIRGVQEIRWLVDSPMNDGDIRNGITADDVEDGDLTAQVTYIIRRTGSNVTLPPESVSTAVGRYEVTYSVQDNDGNIVEAKAELLVYGKLEILTGLSTTQVRQNTLNSYFVPNISSYKTRYFDPVSNGNIEVSSGTHPNFVATDAPSYDISAVGTSTYEIITTHPEFPNGFKGQPITLKSRVNLWVHSPIIIKGYEQIESSIFEVGDTINEARLRTSVTAEFTHAVNGFTNVTNKVTVSPNHVNGTKPHTQQITYTVTDDLIPSNPPTTVSARIQVDGIPTIVTGKETLYVQPGVSVADLIRIAEIRSYFYRGSSPTVQEPIIPEITFAGRLTTPGDSGKLTIVATSPRSGRKVSKEINVHVYRKPKIEISGSKRIEMFKNEFTQRELLTQINVAGTYTDISGQIKTLPAVVDFSAVSLDTGGKYEIKAHIVDPYTGERIESPPIPLFIVNRAYIQNGTAHFWINRNNRESVTEAEIRATINVLGVGEAVIDDKIVVENFPVSVSLERVNVTDYGAAQKLPMSGTYHYRNQTVTSQGLLTIVNRYNKDGGTTVPDKDRYTGTSTSSRPEYGKDPQSMTFWQATDKLITKTGSTKETWRITSTNPNTPTQVTGRSHGVIAVPGAHLEMPELILKNLQKQKDFMLELDLENYYWRLKSESNWKQTNNDYFDLKITEINSREITAKTGRTVPNLQIEMGFDGGWGTKAEFLMRITDSSLQNETLYLYYYNSYTDELEFVNTMHKSNDNWYRTELEGIKGKYVVTSVLYSDVRLIINPDTGGVAQPVDYVTSLLDKGLITVPAFVKNENTVLVRMAIMLLVLLALGLVGYFGYKERKRRLEKKDKFDKFKE